MNTRHAPFFLMLALLAGLAARPALAAGITASVELQAVEFSLAADGEVDLRAAPDTVMSTDPARPWIPVLHRVYALPPETDLATVAVRLVDADVLTHTLPGPVRAAPPLRTSAESVPFYGDATDVVDGRDRQIYGADADYPAEIVRIESVSKMRKWVLVRVAVPAARCNPVRNTLKILSRVEFEISYASGKQALSKAAARDTIMDDAALAMIANAKEARAWYPAPAQTKGSLPAGTGYLIMTTDQIRNESTNLYGLVSHKEALGYDVHVVTETQLDGNSLATGWNEVTGQFPDGKADRMRKWLQDHYISLGIEYVLLIGNPNPAANELPMKEMHYQSYVYPADCYFADLTGNWDIDGNGLYGNETNDVYTTGGVDLDPEVYVGRFPVYTSDPHWPDILRSIIRKTIRYELEPDIGWRSSGLLPQSFSNADTDGAYLGECTRSNILMPNGCSDYTLYQQGSTSASYDSIFTSDEELLNQATPKRWSTNAYGMVLWWAHGWSRGATVYGGGYLFETKYCPMLDNNRPAALFMVSCTCGSPSVSDNLSYSMLKNGGIASVAAGNVSWFYSCQWSPTVAAGHNASMGYHFMRKVIADGKSFGQAHAEVKSDASGWFNNKYTFSLYGDPGLFIGSQGADSDLDGLPDLWEAQHGCVVGTADATANPDGDAYTNLEEYRAGLDPLASDSPGTGRTAVSIAGTFNGWNAAAGNMKLVEDYLWQGTITLTNASAVEFKFAADNGWDLSWGDAGQYATNHHMAGIAEETPENIQAGSGLDGNYRVTFNELTLGYRIEPAPAADTDGDGMPDDWETAHGLNPAVHDAAEDPDHDGRTNLEEYLDGTDPNVWNPPASAYSAMTIAGTFNGWDETETNMFLVDDYTWRCDMSFSGLAGLEFKFTANGAWALNWGDADQIQTGIPMSNTAESGAGNIFCAETLTGLYRATFNEQTGAYTLESIPMLDTDNDGMDDDWETAHGFSPRNAQDAWDDADGDGLCNLEECALNGNPGLKDTDGDGADDFAESVAGMELDNSNSLFAATVDSVPGTDPELSWPGRTGRTYTVYYATNMFNATLEPMPGYSNIPCASPGTMNLTVTNLPVGFHYFGVQVKK